MAKNERPMYWSLTVMTVIQFKTKTKGTPTREAWGGTGSVMGIRGLRVEMCALHIWSASFIKPGLHPAIVLIVLDAPCQAPGLHADSRVIAFFSSSPRRAGQGR